MSKTGNMGLIVKTSAANLYSQPNFTSEMVTQALMYENLEILDKKNNWFRIRQWDGYESWIHQFYTVETDSYPAHTTFTISKRIQWIYSEPDLDSQKIGEILFCTEIPVIEKENNWLKLQIPDKGIGFIESLNFTRYTGFREEIILISKNLMGIPYLWGGKTSKGFDCSGFVQSVFKFSGISLERDSSQQIQNSNLKKVDFIDSMKGDIVFFTSDGMVDHVGIALGDRKIIHCSGEVRIDSLNKNDNDCNTELLGKLYKTFSIEKFINYD